MKNMSKYFLTLLLVATLAVGFDVRLRSEAKVPEGHLLAYDVKTDKWEPIIVTKDTQIFVAGPSGIQQGVVAGEGTASDGTQQMLILPPELLPDSPDEPTTDGAAPQAQKQSNPKDANPPVTKIKPAPLSFKIVRERQGLSRRGSAISCHGITDTTLTYFRRHHVSRSISRRDS